MEPGERPERSAGAAGLDLRPAEVILHRWSAPGGRGILTNFRCVLLGRPLPVRRKVRWAQDLENVTSLGVERIKGVPGQRMMLRGSFGGGAVSTGTVDPTYGVLVDGVPVFIGHPNDCADLQRRIDDARASRCTALYGRVVPFRQPPPPGASSTA